MDGHCSVARFQRERPAGRMWLAFAALAVIAVGLVAAEPADASCLGPGIAYEARDVDRGEVVTVTGKGWGTDCYDTGPPPAGEGALGEPVAGIELVLSQGGPERVVARGAADRDYEFSVDVVIPADAVPGRARISSRRGTSLAGPIGEAFLITDRDPPATTGAGPVTFEGSQVVEPGSSGPPTVIDPTTTLGPTTTVDSATDPFADRSDAPAALDRTGRNLAVGLAIGAAVALVGCALLVRRRRRSRA